VAKTKSRRACPVCGTLFPDDSESCPVCALQGALKSHNDSSSDVSSGLRFEHYTVLQNPDGTPIELGRGAMGVTYKAFDVHLQCPVALKIINARLIGDNSARLRFVREARAAASVRHQNVASVFHLGESGGNYFYAMEFVDGETLEKLIKRSGSLETDLALEIVGQVAAGLTAIQKQHLVHRDIKASNIMVSLEEGGPETVKIIDLGLAKGVAEENTISTLGAFTGTPEYASPEQFAGIAADTRSDLYSLGITLWEMLSGKLPFQGSAAELMFEHQHAALPTEKLRNVPASVIALLQVLLAKDPNQRFQSPAQLRKALPKVREAIDSGLRLTTNDLRSTSDQATEKSSKRKPRKDVVRWFAVSALCLAGLLLAWFFFSGHGGLFFNQRVAQPVPTEKSIAVLPFENISANKDDAYFADGVQDEILNNLAKIAQLKVISRTSVMQYRADSKRDLRQIAAALSVANVLEGTVRREGNHVRVSTELVNARNDNTIWADSYDRDLTDIFSIQSEVAQTIARKLTATLSPQEKKIIEAKPTENLEAYDLYLQAEQLFQAVESLSGGTYEKDLRDATNLLEQAVRLDPKFALAYCRLVRVHDWLYAKYDQRLTQRALGDEAIRNALRLQPDTPEVHLAYAYHLEIGYRDFERAGLQIAIARRDMPNNADAILLEAFIDRRQGSFERAIQEFKEAIALDPRNPNPLLHLGFTLRATRQYAAAERAYDKAIELVPNHPMVRVEKAISVTEKTGDDKALRAAFAALPTSEASELDALQLDLSIALVDRDWRKAAQLIEKMKDRSKFVSFAHADAGVPAGCYEILVARLQEEQLGSSSSFSETREQLYHDVQMSEGDRLAKLLSQLSVVDALLGKKAEAVAEAKRAVEMRPTSIDAVDGPGILLNLGVVYAWSDELELAFQTLDPLIKTPLGLNYGDLKLAPYWDPLRKDPRFDKLLAELAPKD
jgi:serine/threonine protein kinase/Tfp pilus assembly protein PilF